MSTSVFQNASQFSTGDVNIGSTHINNYFNDNTLKDALELLLKHTTKEATHESVTYSYAPTCHPSTRKIIKTDIMDLINSSRNPNTLRFAWLSGPAGAGKSCIQRSIVDECLAGHILGGSFFFGRDSGRDHADGFVATIAHQLCSVVPDFQEAILKKIAFDPSIFGNSLLVQTHRLVLDPLEAAYQHKEWIQPRPITIIVDGLDECRDSAQRLQVVRVLQLLTQLRKFPFCPIVSSRPEFDILTAFGEAPLTRNFPLHAYDSDKDLMAYLVAEFAQIRRKMHLMGIIRESWPTRRVLDTLVKMASGQFIFVSTVIRYLENGREHPEDLLKQVLAAVSTRAVPRNAPANPFAELDSLYSEILRDQANPALYKRTRQILHAIPQIWRVVETNSLLTMSGDLEMGPSPGMLDAFFGTTLTDFCISRLYALLHVPSPVMETRYIRFYHKSMEDYLKTMQRSGNLFQTEADTVAQFLVASTQNLEKWSHSLGSPSEDKAATLSALYLCIRFGWDELPTQGEVSVTVLESVTGVRLKEILKFDVTILLGWILLYGQRLWPNPPDMLNHMKPHNTPLGGLQDHWLDPLAEGVKVLHTCEQSRLAKWKKKCPPFCKTVRLCRRNSRLVLSFLEENWYSNKQEKIRKLQRLEKIVFSGSSSRRRVRSWIQGHPDTQGLGTESPGSNSGSGSSGPSSMVFNFPSRSTQSLSTTSWSSQSSSFASDAIDEDEQYAIRSSSLSASLDNNVGSSALGDRYERTGTETDMEEAISMLREALELRPPPHPDRLTSLNNLGTALWERYQQTRSAADIDEAISMYREALELRPPPHPDRSTSLNNLGTALVERYQQAGSAADMEEAIFIYREALELRPPPHPDRSTSLNNLGTALWERYQQTRTVADMEEAISMLREALELRPPPHPDRSTSLNNLGTALVERYQQAGSAADMEEAIFIYREALELRPPPHPDHSTSLNNLGTALWERYQQTGSAADIDEAISMYREALELRPPPHPDRLTSLDNLGRAIRDRYQQTRTMADMEEAISLLREVLELRPTPHPDRSTSLNNLDMALCDRYLRTRSLADLEEAISLGREALELQPYPHPGRGLSLRNLVMSLEKMCEVRPTLPYLREAIPLCEELLASHYPVGHEDRLETVNRLISLQTRAYMKRLKWKRVSCPPLQPS